MTGIAFLGRIFLPVLHLSLAGAVVIALALLMRAVLGRRRDPRIFHVLWIALAARLLIPWSPAPGFDWRDAASALTGAVPAPAVLESALQPPATPSGARDGLAVGAPAVDWTGVASGIWLAGAAAAAVIFAAAHWRFVSAARRRSDPVGEEERDLSECLDACRAELGVRTPVDLRISAHVSSPAVLGLRKPVILVPRVLVGRLGREEWACIFAHELIHVKRRDALWNALMAAFAAAHWFNPLAWIACRAMREDQELACDAALIRRVDPVRYGHTLMRVAELQAARGSHAAVSFLAGRTKSALRRMEMLFTKKRAMLTLLAALCIAAVSGVAATSPDARTGSAASGPEDGFIVPAYGTFVWGFGDPHKYNVYAVAIAAEEGTPVYATADGVVVQAGYAGEDGNRIAIDHAGGFESVYNHLRDILVAEGERVKRGQQIGTVGSTGNSTGPQLSFELLRDGEFVDPESVIEFDLPRRES